MAIIINSNNYLDKNLLIRDGCLATYKHITHEINPTFFKTCFTGGTILAGNWAGSDGPWLADGIQKSSQLFETKMSELRKPIMDEKWFAIILLHLTGWEYLPRKTNSQHSSSYCTRVELVKLQEFLDTQGWDLYSLDQTSIFKITEEYVYLHESIIQSFFNEIDSQEKFLREYAHKEFIKNNVSSDYLWIEGEITQNVLDTYVHCTKNIKKQRILIYLKDVTNAQFFEFEFKGYIEDYVVYFEETTWFVLTDKFFEHFFRFQGLNQAAMFKQSEFDSIVENMPMMIELKKQSKSNSKINKISLTQAKKILLKQWGIEQPIELFGAYLRNYALGHMIKNKVVCLYSNMKKSTLFRLGKNHIGVQVYVKETAKLNHIASSNIEFADRFRETFKVKPITGYNHTEEILLNKGKDDLYLEVNDLSKISSQTKQLIFTILAQGRSIGLYLWFNLQKNDMMELLSSTAISNITTLYSQKDICEKYLELIHPQLHKLIEDVFVHHTKDGALTEFLL